MSKSYYNKLEPLQILVETTIGSATGSNLGPIGVVNCTVRLGHRKFENPIIVCKNMHCPLIIGGDFLSNKVLGVYYNEQGKRHLEYKHKEKLIESVDIDDNPKLLLHYACTIPGRALAVLNVHSTIKKQHEGHVYNIEVNQDIIIEYPNLVVISSLHRVECCETKTLPFVIVNLDHEKVDFKKESLCRHISASRY